jgi:hypothetical protein
VKALGFSTGVSLHSHTSASEETLSFVHQMGIELPFASYLFAHYTRIARERHNITLDFLSAHWRPPLLPKMAFDLERAQIEALGLEAMISITDHDNIQAPLLLRTISAARRIPVSVEWTTPFGKTAFHLGIHNIPSDAALDWMQRFERFTAAPGEERLGPMLRELDAIPQVLIVLNHPLWDLYKVGDRDHRAELDRFLRNNNVHALELNGLRHARENRDVVQLARRWNQTLISGGDRHGLEPNANINLTNASSFTDFVREIRVERRSHVLFLDQYRKPWEQRILESTLDAITDHPHFSPGWQRWDERAFHKDADGVMRPMAELWSNGRMPVAMRLFIGFIRLFRFRTLARTLSLTCPGVNQASIDAGLLQDAA